MSILNALRHLLLKHIGLGSRLDGACTAAVVITTLADLVALALALAPGDDPEALELPLAGNALVGRGQTGRQSHPVSAAGWARRLTEAAIVRVCGRSLRTFLRDDAPRNSCRDAPVPAPVRLHERADT